MSHLPLYILLGLLSIDSLIEVGFIGSMVGYLHHNHADVPFAIQGPQGTIQLFPKPAQLIVHNDQGHTSNGAAGTALILVGLGGCIALSWLKRREGSVCNFHYKS